MQSSALFLLCRSSLAAPPLRTASCPSLIRRFALLQSKSSTRLAFRAFATKPPQKKPPPPVKSTAVPGSRPIERARPTIKPTEAQKDKVELPAAKPFEGTTGHDFGSTGERGYPESLLIYSAGNGRTLFIGAVRLTGIFIFIFSALLIAPAYWISPFENSWMAPVVVVAGAIPLTVMTMTTAPFVTYVHLALPHWARSSNARLHRFAASLPSTATIDISSIRWLWPRVTRLQAHELHIHKGQLMGAMTLRRDVPQRVKDARKWWMWRPLTKFYVGGKSGGKVVEKGVWESVIQNVARGWEKQGIRDKVLVKNKV